MHRTSRPVTESWFFENHEPIQAFTNRVCARRTNDCELPLVKEQRWTDGGAFVPTAMGTFLSFMAAVFTGLGGVVILFGAWIPSIVFLAMGTAMWFTGRWLIDR